MTEHERAPDAPETPDAPEAVPPTTIPGASTFGALDPPSRLAAIGAAIVGAAALLEIATGGLHSGPILLIAAAVALALIVGILGRGWSPAARGGLLLLAATLATVLAAFDLVWGIRHMDDPRDVGGGIGLVARVGALAGGVVLGLGAIRLRGAADVADAVSVPAQTPNRLALGGALLVVVGWALMLLVADGWALVLDQAIGVSAAIALGGLALLVGGGAIRLSKTVELGLMVGLAAIVVVMALNSVLSVADEWSIVVDVGGPLTFVPYLVYLAGVAVIAAAGVMLAMRLRPAPTG
jgi:hypothetical protein